MRKHNRNTRAVVSENIRDIRIIMRKHKMQTITQVVNRFILKDNRRVYKFKINSITVTLNRISNDLQTVAMPAMNAIAAFLVSCAATNKAVILDQTIHACLQVNSKKCIVQNVISNGYVPFGINFYGSKIYKA